MEKKKVLHDPASHSHNLIRNRSGVLTDVHSYRQSQCPQLYAGACLAQSRRWLDGHPHLSGVRHHAQYIHPGTPTVSLWRTESGAARPKATAPSPCPHGRTNGSSHCHRLHPSLLWPRPLDLTLAGRASCRIGICRVHSPETIRHLLKK
jgi:hypothetical protein